MNETYRKLHQRLTAGLDVLPDKPDENPENTLRALWHAATGKPRSIADGMHDELPELRADGEHLRTLEHFVSRRLAGEPLAYITGRQRFMGLDMLSGPQALIPRAETEQLAHASIELLRQPSMPSPAMVIDVCSGSGNLAFAIAHHVPGTNVFGSDLSEEAVALAERNGQHLGLQNGVQFRTGDLLAPFEHPEFSNCIDLIVCAPPYIRSAKVEQMAAEIADHEPRLAFDGGPLGVTILMRLVEDAPRLLRAGGWLALEVGLGQGPALTGRLRRNPAWQETRTLADADGATRVILACLR